MKICSVVPLPALKACSSAMIFLACGFDFFSMIYSIVLLVWLMRLLIRWFLHSCKVPFLGSVMTKDWVHGVGHSPVCQIVVKAVITSSRMLGPVLLGYCQLRLTSLSSVIVLQPPRLFEGWGGRPLCLPKDSSVLIDLRWPCDCTAKSSILSIVSVSLILL